MKMEDEYIGIYSFIVLDWLNMIRHMTVCSSGGMRVDSNGVFIPRVLDDMTTSLYFLATILQTSSLLSFHCIYRHNSCTKLDSRPVSRLDMMLCIIISNVFLIFF